MQSGKAQFIKQNPYKTIIGETTIMKLNYRGVTYNRQPLTLEVTEGEIAGKYRGQEWHHTYPRHIPNLQPKLHLQYRGIHYSTRPMVGEGSPIVPLQPFAQPVRQTQPQSIVDSAATAHLNSIRRNLEHRLQVALERGDAELVEMLERESQELSLTM